MKLDDDPIKIPMYDRDCRTELLEKVKEIFATKSRKIDEAKEKKRQEAEAKKNLEKKAQDLINFMMTDATCRAVNSCGCVTTTPRVTGSPGCLWVVPAVEGRGWSP